MDDHVYVRKQGLQRGVFVREQIEGFDPFDGVARGIHLLDVDEPQLVALPERRQELACYVAWRLSGGRAALHAYRSFRRWPRVFSQVGDCPPYLLTITGFVHRGPLSGSVSTGVEYPCLDARGDGAWTPTRSN